MTYEEKVNHFFPEDKYFKVSVRFITKTDPKYNKDQLDFHLGNKAYNYIIRGDKLVHYLLLNDCDIIISEGGRFLSRDYYIGLPLVFINSSFRYYENAVVITKIEEATSVDVNKLVEVTGVTPFSTLRDEFPGNNNLYSSEISNGCYGLIRCHNLMLSYSQNVETIMLIRCH